MRNRSAHGKTLAVLWAVAFFVVASLAGAFRSTESASADLHGAQLSALIQSRASCVTCTTDSSKVAKTAPRRASADGSVPHALITPRFELPARPQLLSRTISISSPATPILEASRVAHCARGPPARGAGSSVFVFAQTV